jgi:hypothetical protein
VYFTPSSTNLKERQDEDGKRIISIDVQDLKAFNTELIGKLSMFVERQ